MKVSKVWQPGSIVSLEMIRMKQCIPVGLTQGNHSAPTPPPVPKEGKAINCTCSSSSSSSWRFSRLVERSVIGCNWPPTCKSSFKLASIAPSRYLISRSCHHSPSHLRDAMGYFEITRDLGMPSILFPVTVHGYVRKNRLTTTLCMSGVANPTDRSLDAAPTTPS